MKEKKQHKIDLCVGKDVQRNVFSYKQIIENMIDVIMWVDKNGDVTFVTPSMEKEMGYSSEDVCGESLMNFVYKDEVEIVEKKFEEAYLERKPGRFELRTVKKNGDILWVEIIYRPLFDKSGEFQGFIINARDINERKADEKLIRYLSFHDKLTGLYNRAFFEEELKRLDTERQLSLSIIMGDVNALKLINDAFGHEQGDLLLIRAAQVLKNACRQEDMLARWGGDEFVILLPNTSENDAKEVINRAKSLSQDTPKEPFQLSIALGSATRVNMNRDVCCLFREAEDRMYRKKLSEGKKVKISVLESLNRRLELLYKGKKEHIERLMNMASRFGKYLNLSNRQEEQLIASAKYHDIGKVQVPYNILLKPSMLTEEEWGNIIRHCEVGYRIILSTIGDEEIAEVILEHHERWDGTGYPREVKGTDILFLARIFSIMDAYEIMTYGALYKEPISKVDAIEELKRNSGTQFDPELVKKFVDMLSK